MICPWNHINGINDRRVCNKLTRIRWTRLDRKIFNAGRRRRWVKKIIGKSSLVLQFSPPLHPSLGWWPTRIEFRWIIIFDISEPTFLNHLEFFRTWPSPIIVIIRIIVVLLTSFNWRPLPSHRNAPFVHRNVFIADPLELYVTVSGPTLCYRCSTKQETRPLNVCLSVCLSTSFPSPCGLSLVAKWLRVCINLL